MWGVWCSGDPVLDESQQNRKKTELRFMEKHGHKKLAAKREQVLQNVLYYIDFFMLYFVILSDL